LDCRIASRSSGVKSRMPAQLVMKSNAANAMAKADFIGRLLDVHG
jgi:hypothetical protein